MGVNLVKKKYTILLCMTVTAFALATGCGKAKKPVQSGENIRTEDTSSAGQEPETEGDAGQTSETAVDAGQTPETTENAGQTPEATGDAGQTPEATGDAQQASLEDGIYTVDFDTDSSMFHVNEACEGKGKLTVADGKMVLHISLPSKNVVNLFPGLADDAKKEGAQLLWPTIDTVTYSDGMTEEVHGFDIPVTVLEEEFDLALLGTKGTWYDHKVSVSNPVKADDEEGAKGSGNDATDNAEGTASALSEEGTYAIDVTLEGGSGRASVASPAKLIVKDGASYAHIEWSSPHYDYMKIGDETYYPVNTEGNSAFEFPVSALDEKLPVIADTTAMGTPHEIEYTLTFHSDSIEKQ